LKRRAFTLIELLVVIAIIAILAAILFPVFAQAKEAAKKTADLSNVKQLATGVAIYTNDYDDLGPLQAGQDVTGIWGYNYNKYFPWNWPVNPSPTARGAYSQDSFANSMQPYCKNHDMFVEPGSSQALEYQPTNLPIATPKWASSYAYNGLLTAWSMTSIAQPAMLPLITEVNGFANELGWTFANPALTCGVAHASCSYVPDNNGVCGTGNGATSAVYQNINGGVSSYWCYSQGENWALTDTHAKFRKMGATLKPANTDYKTDPMTQYNTVGDAGYYWSDGCHPWLFRPDYQFNQ